MARSKNEKPATTSTKKSEKSSAKGSPNNWERFVGVLAILLSLFAIYLLVCIVSFFASGGADISHLNVTAKELMAHPELKIQNAGGRWGAIIGNFLINKGFGIASLGFIYFLIIFALRLGKLARFSMSRNLGYGLFLIIWTSIALGYFFSSLYNKSFLIPGGQYGYFMSQLLNATVGSVGTFFLILGSILICIIVAFEQAWPLLKRWLSYRRVKAAKTLKKEEFPVAPEPLEEDDAILEITQAPVITTNDEAYVRQPSL